MSYQKVYLPVDQQCRSAGGLASARVRPHQAAHCSTTPPDPSQPDAAEPERLSGAATEAIAGADELAVAGITWYELAWLATHERIVVTIPIPSWLARLAAGVRSVSSTPAIAHTTVALPSTFPGDLADRLIYATAVELGWCLVSKDRRLREHPHPREITIW